MKVTLHIYFTPFGEAEQNVLEEIEADFLPSVGDIVVHGVYGRIRVTERIVFMKGLNGSNNSDYVTLILKRN